MWERQMAQSRARLSPGLATWQETQNLADALPMRPTPTLNQCSVAVNEPMLPQSRSLSPNRYIIGSGDPRLRSSPSTQNLQNFTANGYPQLSTNAYMRAPTTALTMSAASLYSPESALSLGLSRTASASSTPPFLMRHSAEGWRDRRGLQHAADDQSLQRSPTESVLHDRFQYISDENLQRLHEERDALQNWLSNSATAWKVLDRRAAKLQKARQRSLDALKQQMRSNTDRHTNDGNDNGHREQLKAQVVDLGNALRKAEDALSALERGEKHESPLKFQASTVSPDSVDSSSFHARSRERQESPSRLQAFAGSPDSIYSNSFQAESSPLKALQMRPRSPSPRSLDDRSWREEREAEAEVAKATLAAAEAAEELHRSRSRVLEPMDNQDHVFKGIPLKPRSDHDADRLQARLKQTQAALAKEREDRRTSRAAWKMAMHVQDTDGFQISPSKSRSNFQLPPADVVKVLPDRNGKITVDLGSGFTDASSESPSPRTRNSPRTTPADRWAEKYPALFSGGFSDNG